jgi:hypothetical protein
MAARVVVSSKPHLVDKLRSSWRTTGEQRAMQLWRFLRLTVTTLVGELFAQLVANGFDLTGLSHIGQKAAVALVVGAAETAWRQLHPALTASAVDSAPGATIVPAQLDQPAPEGDAAP